MDARTQAALDQLSAIEDELDAAICWADKPDGDGVPHVMGRNVRHCAELLKAAIANLKPAPGKATVRAIVGQHRALVNEERRTMAADQLALSIPAQSRPAFSNRSGAR